MHNAAYVYETVGQDCGKNRGGFQILGCEGMKILKFILRREHWRYGRGHFGVANSANPHDGEEEEEPEDPGEDDDNDDSGEETECAEPLRIGKRV